MRKEERRQSELPPGKREQILAGARTLFREQGFERTSVDAIAARAQVSKATIYNHFRSKEALFLATFGTETAQVREKFLSLLETPSGDIRADLHRIGEQLLRLVTSSSNVCRYRVVTAESARFPELGRALFACSVQVGQAQMARFFAQAGELGFLEVGDPAEAAVDFGSLCTHELSRMLHLGVVDEVSEEMIAGHVQRGVRTFLRAYLPR